MNVKVWWESLERENKMGFYGIRVIIKKIESFWYFCVVKGKIIGGILFLEIIVKKIGFYIDVN